MSLKSKKLFVDGRTYGRINGHLRLTLLGRLGGVDQKTWKIHTTTFPSVVRRDCRWLIPIYIAWWQRNVCEQLAYGCYLRVERPGVEPRDVEVTSPTP